MEFQKDLSGIRLYSEGEKLGWANCHYTENAVEICHVIVVPEARGQGIASKIVSEVVSEAEADHKKIIPTCPYAAWWMTENKKE